MPTEEDEKKHMPKDDIPGGTPVPAADLPVHK